MAPALAHAIPAPKERRTRGERKKSQHSQGPAPALAPASAAFQGLGLGLGLGLVWFINPSTCRVAYSDAVSEPDFALRSSAVRWSYELARTALESSTRALSSRATTRWSAR